MCPYQSPVRTQGPADTVRKFQDRVDYVAKALRRGSWGRRFNTCFDGYDGDHVIAVVMRRAENNLALRSSVMAAFGTREWQAVPWQAQAKRFAAMTTRDIAVDAERVREACLTEQTEAAAMPRPVANTDSQEDAENER